MAIRRQNPSLPLRLGDQRRKLNAAADRLAEIEREIDLLAESNRDEQVEWEKAHVSNRPGNAWQTLTPQTAIAKKMKPTIRDDATVFLSGPNAANDTYTVSYQPQVREIAAIRLETLRHPSMTQGRLARSNSGNFVLTDIRFTLINGEQRTPLSIASAEATVEQSSSLTITKAF